MSSEGNSVQTHNTVKKEKEFINHSGKGDRYSVPRVIKDKFNWGAFLLSWIWGLGNKTYITLLILLLGLIPVVGFAVQFWFGIKGNEWAWQNKRFAGIRQFHEHQKKWAMWGVIVNVVVMVILAVFYLSSLMMLMSMTQNVPGM